MTNVVPECSTFQVDVTQRVLQRSSNKEKQIDYLSRYTFKIGSTTSSGSKITDLEQTLNEPRIFLEKEKNITGDSRVNLFLALINSIISKCSPPWE